MKKAIIFDFDGVIINTFDMCVDVNKEIQPNMTAEEYRDRSNGNYYKAMNKTALDPASYEYFKEYAKRLIKMDPEQGMPEVLGELSTRYVLYIVTSSLKGPINDFLDKHSISYFDEIVDAEDDVSKVAKINHILSHHNFSKENVIFITDTLGDIKEAEEAGINTIAVTWGWHDSARLAQGKPQATVHSPEELLKTILATH